MKEGSQITAAKSDYPNRKFTLKKKIGEGAQGFVYFAVPQFWGNNSNKEFALKFSPSQTVQEQEYNFIKQLMDYQSSKNEESFPCNMMRILDIFEYQNYIVTVMEKGEQDLYCYLEQNRQKITTKEKNNLCLDVVMPIYQLHAYGLVHRDIKPEHFIKVGDKFKLFDFGLIRKIDRMDDFNMTKNVGTILFSAPEMIDNFSNYTYKVDVWSLGCLFYEIFNPNPLFDGNCFEQIRQQILNHKNNPKFVHDKIDKLNCDLPMKNLMKLMLEFDQNKRLNIQQVLEQLYASPQQPQLNETTLNEKFLEIEKKFLQSLEEQKQQLNQKNLNQFKTFEDRIKQQQTQIEQYQKKQEDQQNKQKQDIEKELQKLINSQIKQSYDFTQQIQQQKVQYIDPIQVKQIEDNYKLELLIKQKLQQDLLIIKNKYEVDQQQVKVQQQIQQISDQLKFIKQQPSEPDKDKLLQNQQVFDEMEKIRLQLEQYQNQQQQYNVYFDQQIQQLQEYYNQSLAYQQALYQEHQQMKEDQTNADAIKKQQQEIQQINSKLAKEIENQNNEIQNQIRKLNFETLKKQINSLEDKSKQLKQEIDDMKKLKADSQLLDLKEAIVQQKQLYSTQQEQQNQIKLKLNKLNETMSIHQKNLFEQEVKCQFVQELCEKLKTQIYQDFSMLQQHIEQKVNQTQVQELKDADVEINKQIKLFKSEILSNQIQSKNSIEINDQEFLQFKLNKVQQDYQTCQQKLQSQESLISTKNQQLQEQAEQITKLNLENGQLQKELQKNIQEKNSVKLDLFTSSKETQKLKQEIQELQQQLKNIKSK